MRTHDLIGRVLTFVSIDRTEVASVPVQELISGQKEAYYLGAVLLSYGFGEAQEGFSGYYPIFVKELVFYRDKVNLNENVEENHANYDIGACLALVLTKGVNIAGYRYNLGGPIDSKFISLALFAKNEANNIYNKNNSIVNVMTNSISICI